jgi:hypothetical protein
MSNDAVAGAVVAAVHARAMGLGSPWAGPSVFAQVARAQSVLAKVMAQSGFASIGAAATQIEAAIGATSTARWGISPATAAVAVATARTSGIFNGQVTASRVLARRSPFNSTLQRVMELVRRAREALDAGLDLMSERLRERRQLGSELATSFSAHERLAYAALRTTMAMRLHVDRSPPPREALTTTPRTLRGPSPAGRPHLVVVRLRELPC